MENTLPGIVKIQYVRCADIQPHVMYLSLCGAIVDLALPAVQIKYYGTPSLKWDGTTVNGGRQETSSLEFATTAKLPEGERLAFVITTASGKQYLIGTREPKYPQISYSETVGAPDGNAALRIYKITHIARKSVLPCIL
ncbi:MAG: hypothetical protein HDS60_03710 [Barnesiella sp.]|nr:hypothetical protein [Barnesiella sp.]